MPATRHRASTLSATAFRELRERAEMTRKEWGILLDFPHQSVCNAENGAPISRQTARLAMLLAEPAARKVLASILQEKDELCKKRVKDD